MNPTEDRLAALLSRARTIAVVGLSDLPHRTSHRIASYLQAAGYRIVPVNPRVREVLGERAYPRLAEVEEAVDIVDVFRRREAIPSLAEEFLEMPERPAAFWMQKGLSEGESARRLEASRVEVVQNMCIKTAHRRLMTDRGLE
ncbi:MAG: CoA-binding protein [bacterium]